MGGSSVDLGGTLLGSGGGSVVFDGIEVGASDVGGVARTPEQAVNACAAMSNMTTGTDSFFEGFIMVSL
jgi:hypothetical protein